MNKFWKIILIILGLIVLIFAILYAIGFFKPQKAGIQIESMPSSTVFINGVKVGKTPFEATQDPGEITLKLIPDPIEKPLVGFEVKILLTSGIKTVVKRNFAETEALSSGEIISFEKTGESQASLAVVSNPDSAQVAIDGNPRGFAPYKTSSITRGTHQIAISASGYEEKTLTVNILSGYKLTALIKLSQLENQVGITPTPSPSPTPAPKTMIEILKTPNGFLRVREEPNVGAKEIGRVDSGQKFLLQDTDVKTGWYKIEFLTGQEGWVSNQYATPSASLN